MIIVTTVVVDTTHFSTMSGGRRVVEGHPVDKFIGRTEMTRYHAHHAASSVGYPVAARSNPQVQTALRVISKRQKR